MKTCGPRRKGHPTGGAARWQRYGQRSERTTREQRRDLSGLRLAISAVVVLPAGPSSLETAAYGTRTGLMAPVASDGHDRATRTDLEFWGGAAASISG
jgi:hypothetical protein